MAILMQTSYSLRPILLFANKNVSRHILVLDTSILAKSNMGRREYQNYMLREIHLNLQETRNEAGLNHDAN
jgi:hypothetical protein